MWEYLGFSLHSCRVILLEYRILELFSFHRLKNVFPKYIRGENNPKLIPRASITLIPKSDEYFTKKTTDHNLMLVYVKNPQQNTSKPNPTTHKRNYTLWSNRIYLRKSRWVQHLKIMYLKIYHIKTNLIISTDADLKKWQNLIPFHDKRIHQTRNRREHLQPINGIYEKHTANVYLIVKCWKLPHL